MVNEVSITYNRNNSAKHFLLEMTLSISSRFKVSWEMKHYGYYLKKYSFYFKSLRKACWSGYSSYNLGITNRNKCIGAENEVSFHLMKNIVR